MKDQARVLRTITRLLDGLPLDIARLILQLAVAHYGLPGEEERALDRARKRRGNSTEIPRGNSTESDTGNSALAPVVSTASSSSVVARSVRPTELQELMQYYIDEFIRKHGHKPLINRGKDYTLLADIQRQMGPAEARVLLTQFFETDDEFVRKAGHSVGVFHAVCNRILSGNGAGNRTIMSERTRGNMDAVRAFVEGDHGPER